MRLLAFVLPLVDFDLRLEVLIIGVISGMVYGLLGLGLSLIYRSTRIINFAHAQVGALASGIALRLVLFDEHPYVVGILAAVAVAVVVGVLIEVVVVRRLKEAPRLIMIIATIGVSQVLVAAGSFAMPEIVATNIRLAQRAALGYPTPFKATVNIGTLSLHEGELMILAVVPLIVAGLTLFLRRSYIGLASRAAAENLEAARLSGIPEARVSMLVWVIAALLSVTCAVLVGPTKPAMATFSLGPGLMIRALAASLVGGFSSMPQVFAGGILVGVVEAFVRWNYPTGGVVELVIFALILVAMFVRRELGRSARGGEESSWSLAGTVQALEPRIARARSVLRARRIGLAVALGVALLLPLPASSSTRVLLSSVVLFAVMGLSITVLTGFAGQVSLAQYTFVALGGVIGGRVIQLGFPAWVGLVYAVVGGAALAALVGLPALRLRGLLLAVTTLAFAVAGGSWLVAQDWLVVVEDGRSSLTIPRPTIFGIDFQSERNYYYLCLGVLVLVALLVNHLRHTGLGRTLMAVRDNDASAAALSVSPQRVKLLGFALAGGIAALAGYFYSGLLVNFTEAPGLTSAQLSQSLLAMVVFGGTTSVTGAVLGAAYVEGIPYFFGMRWGILSSGVGLLVVLLFLPGGLSSLVFRVRNRIVSRLTGEPISHVRPTSEIVTAPRKALPAAPTTGSLDAPSPLRADDVVVRFGGLTAVASVSIEARQHEIVGLLGPNGAGKTTLFDVLGGQLRPQSGTVHLHGVDVSDLRPEGRAKLGLGRSFQQALLFPELRLIDTIKVALEADEPSEAVPSLLGLPPSRRSERLKQTYAEELLDLLGLAPFANRLCGELSTGTRRFAELGCLIASGSRVLLLDEPTSGIAQREVEQFPAVLREIRDHLGATMVIVAHDIPMMMALVDRLYVMAAGAVIAEGPPQLLRDDPAVVAAYLGTDDPVEVAAR